MEYNMITATTFRPYRLTAVLAAWTAYRNAKRLADRRAVATGYTDAEKKAAKSAADTAYAAYTIAAQDLAGIISAAEGRASVRRLDVADIMAAIDDVPDCILKKHLPGCKIYCNPCAQDFPSAYGYRPESTHFTAEHRSRDWYLTNVYRDTCTSSRGRLVLTDGAKADIIAAAEAL